MKQSSIKKGNTVIAKGLGYTVKNVKKYEIEGHNLSLYGVFDNNGEEIDVLRITSETEPSLNDFHFSFDLDLNWQNIAFEFIRKENYCVDIKILKNKTFIKISELCYFSLPKTIVYIEHEVTHKAIFKALIQFFNYYNCKKIENI